MKGSRKKGSFWLKSSSLSALILSVLTTAAIWLLLQEKKQDIPLLLPLIGLLLFFFFRTCMPAQNSLLSRRAEYALAILFSASTVLGILFDRNISFGSMSFWQFLEWILCSSVLTEFFRRLLLLLCSGLAAWAQKEKVQTESGYPLTSKTGRPFLSERPGLCFLFSLAVILLCWLPVWLAYYPGLWNYDPWQADQVITGIYSKHHPLLHTLFLGSCYRFALRQGNANLAPILYTIIQGGVCASVYALACVWIRLKSRSTVFYILTLLFFALFPVHPILVMSTTKDTLFSAMILLAGLLFLFMESCSPRRKKWLIVIEIPVLALVILFRNNAMYCFFLLILLCLFRIRKPQWRRILAVLIAGTALGVGLDRGLGVMLHATPALTAEMCSVPSQMAGRVQEKVKPLDPETRSFLDTFYVLDELSYSPSLADGTKCCLLLESREDLLRYAQGSFRMMLKYPAISLDSLLYTTEGLWNILDTSHTQIYGMENRQGYLSTDIQSGYQIEPDSKLPWLESFLEKLLTENAFLKIPILRFLFAPALYVGLLLFSFFIMLKGKNRKLMLIPLFLLLLVVTIVLGPGILPRYIYPLMVCAPVLIWLVMKSATDRV